ncbi:unnamed protein product [Owenia fusiformis]|uniref:Protein-PII uridylyltransferase N-terminal domain-containing protein n=1 Tax=Owenia fusiformis TaxID=6347 RepID=A0A8S4Q932_OWEFU|nr:unnamed protein product [Owenia fusiformis]
MFQNEAAIRQLQTYIRVLRKKYPDKTLELDQLKIRELEITKSLKEIPSINKNLQKDPGNVSKEEWKRDRLKHVQLLRQLGNLHKDIAKIESKPMGYVKAISIYETGIVQCGAKLPSDSELSKYKEERRSALKLFFKNCIGTDISNKYFDDEQTNKDKLEAIRSELKERISQIDKNKECNCYETGITNEEEKTKHEVERIKHIGEIFKWIFREMKTFIQSLVQQTLDLLNFYDKDFALIAFGSFSRKETTPFSDVEFAVVQNSEELEMKREYRETINKMVMILHLKFLAFGETVLPAMSVPSLNEVDLNDKTKDWYLDLRSYVNTKQGISFDGLMPNANKTPYYISPQNYRFRLTNTKAAFIENYCEMEESDLKRELYFFKGDFTTLYGDKSVEDDLKKAFKENKARRETILKLIKNQLSEDLVKHSCIKKMYDELRLRCYTEGNGQVDEKKGQLLPKLLVKDGIEQSTFSTDLILRYYQTAIPLVYAIEEEKSRDTVEKIGQTSLYDPSDLNNAIAYMLMQNPEKAKEHLIKANETCESSEPTRLIMHILCNMYIEDDNIIKSFLDNLKPKVIESKNPDTMNTYGVARQQKGDIGEAIEVLETSVEESPQDINSLTLLLSAYEEGGETTKKEYILNKHPALAEIHKLRNDLEKANHSLEIAEAEVHIVLLDL